MRPLIVFESLTREPDPTRERTVWYDIESNYGYTDAVLLRFRSWPALRKLYFIECGWPL